MLCRTTQTWPGALGLFILVVGSVAGLTYYGIQKHGDVRTETTDSSAAVEATYTSGDWIDDGGVADATTDLSVTNPKTYTDKSASVRLVCVYVSPYPSVRLSNASCVGGCRVRAAQLH